jgi:Legionella pneumophila major outer membrane protein precursor
MELKKISIALMALGLSGVASAAMYQPPAPPACTGHNVIVPCEKTGWRVGASALLGEQTNDDGWYAETDVSDNGNNSTAIKAFNVGERYAWGFDIFGAYQWRQGHEVYVDWTRIHNDTDSNSAYNDVTNANTGIVVRNVNALVGTAINGQPNVADEAISAVTAKGDFEFDQVNLELAQYVHMGDYVDTRMAFGGSYVRLDHDLNVEAWGTATNATTSYWTASKSSFDGLGPRASLAATWNVVKNDNMSWGLTGKAASSLLVGDLCSKVERKKTVSYTTASGGVSGTVVRNTNYSEHRTVVPEASGSVAITGTYNVGSTGKIRGDLGWKAQGVFHAISHSLNESNYGYHGPFLSLQYIA